MLDLAPPQNETVLAYAPGAPERDTLMRSLAEMRAREVEIPLVVGGERRMTEESDDVVMPHRRRHRLARAARARGRDVADSVEAAREARGAWSARSLEDRARVFLRAADIIAGPRRARLNAATMLGQSKTAHQAEIDAVCELVDFLRFNAEAATRLQQIQPRSTKGVLNTLELRPLDGPVFAVTPFNFTAIAGNLPTAPALMGNTVVWKPAPTQILAAQETMHALEAAGLPDGVINLVSGDAPAIAERVLSEPDLAGLHFTGSTETFIELQRGIAKRLDGYISYPRVVGETGGKDFIVAHASADVPALATAIVRGGYEYQGQKCSAASRVFVPASLVDDLLATLIPTVRQLPMGDPTEDLSVFLGAVIDHGAFTKIMSYVDRAHEDPAVEVLAGGEGDASEGYFIRPTLLRVDDPKHALMTEEIFGPVVSLCVYPDDAFDETLEAVEGATDYALTGAIFARDREAIRRASEALRFAAGNFYINDKPTGSVVGQQPFGGSRRSGTNDKAGSIFNLMRWVSPRAIKETFVPPVDHRYPYMGKEVRA